LNKIKLVAPNILYNYFDETRVAESEVKYSTPTTSPTIPKFPTPTPDSDSSLSEVSDSDSRLRHLNIKGMTFGC